MNHAEISLRAFYYTLMDLTTLRNRFARTQDVSHVVIGKMSREKLVHGMLAHEFGVDAVIEYVSMCKAWDRDRTFVED